MENPVLTKHSTKDSKTKKVVQLDNPKQSSQKTSYEPDMKELLEQKLQQLASEPSTAAQEPSEDGKGFHGKVDEMIAKVNNLQTSNLDMGVKERAALLKDLYHSEVIKLLKNLQEQSVQFELDAQQYETQFQTFAYRNQRADLIRQKLELVTREYSDQNKHFQVKHTEIKDAEVAKRDQISENFETHITQIRQQMDEEREQLKIKNDDPAEGEPEFFENEIVKENKMLAHKYEELMKEIEEKSKLMESQLATKDGTTATMEAQIANDIEKQEKNVAEQTELYKQQTEQKRNEEKELLKILKDYKGKYLEFEKATKKTKDYYKNFEKEIRMLEAKKKELAQTKVKFEKQYKKKKGVVQKEEDEVKELEQKWEAEKLQLNKERETLKEQCAQIQEAIKAKKAASAAQ